MLDGVDVDNPGTALDRSGHPNPVPRITGPIRRRHPVNVDAVRFLRAHSDRTIKVTVPGPFTMSEQAQNDYYPTKREAAFGYAEAVNAEVADLFAAGADIVQLDEPYLQARAETAKDYGVAVVNAALAGITGTTALHLCFGYAAIIHDRPSGYSFLPELAASSADQISIETAQSGLDCGVLADLAGKTIILGVLDLSTAEVEKPEQIAARARKALPYVPAWPARAGSRLRHEISPAGLGGRQAGGPLASGRASQSRVRWLAACPLPLVPALIASWVLAGRLTTECSTV